MRAKCPSCGKEFDAKRRPVGAGTEIDPKTPLSYTESQLYQWVNSAPKDVRGWQETLITVGIRKNYHQVQAALSTLVGRGLVRMDVSVFPPRYERV